MTEDAWRASGEPLEMVTYLLRQPSQRKLRLLAAACCRQVWERLTDPRSQRAVEAAEEFADGLIDGRRLFEVCESAYEASTAAAETGGAIWGAASAAASSSHPNILARIRGDGGAVGMAAYQAKANRRRQQADTIRDIFGNPFQSTPLDPSWREWHDATVVNLAQAAYDKRELPSGHLETGRLGILADALEEAGCTNETILGHLRGPGPHVRGCWVVDVLLGGG